MSTTGLIPSCRVAAEYLQVCASAPADVGAPGGDTFHTAGGLPLSAVALIAALAVLAVILVVLRIQSVRHAAAATLARPASEPPVIRTATPDRDRSFEDLVQGLIGTYDLADSELVRAHVQKSLRGVGIVAISPEPGEPFDAVLHNGVAGIPAPDPDLAFRIARVLRPGWKSKGGILRPADVEVYRG